MSCKDDPRFQVYDPAIRLTFDAGNEYLPVRDPRGDLIAFSTDRQPGDWRDIGGVNVDETNEGMLALGLQSAFCLGPGSFSWVGMTGQLITNETISGHKYLAFDTSRAPFTRSEFNGGDAAFKVVLGISGGGGGGFFKVSRDGSTAIWRHSSSGGGRRTTIRTAPYDSLGTSRGPRSNMPKTLITKMARNRSPLFRQLI